MGGTTAKRDEGLFLDLIEFLDGAEEGRLVKGQAADLRRRFTDWLAHGRDPAAPDAAAEKVRRDEAVGAVKAVLTGLREHETLKHGALPEVSVASAGTGPVAWSVKLTGTLR